MARKTKRTLRKLSPLAREMAKFGNELDRLNKWAMRLTEKVAEREHLADAAEAFMVKTKRVKAVISIPAEPRDGGS